MAAYPIFLAVFSPTSFNDIRHDTRQRCITKRHFKPGNDQIQEEKCPDCKTIATLAPTSQSQCIVPAVTRWCADLAPKKHETLPLPANCENNTDWGAECTVLRCLHRSIRLPGANSSTSPMFRRKAASRFIRGHSDLVHFTVPLFMKEEGGRNVLMLGTSILLVGLFSISSRPKSMMFLRLRPPPWSGD